MPHTSTDQSFQLPPPRRSSLEPGFCGPLTASMPEAPPGTRGYPLTNFAPPYMAASGIYPPRTTNPQTLLTPSSIPTPTANPSSTETTTSSHQRRTVGRPGLLSELPSSSMAYSFPQAIPMARPNLPPSSLYPHSPMIPHPAGNYPRPHFGPCSPLGFFPGVQYYPQSFPYRYPAEVIRAYENHLRRYNAAQVALNMEFMKRERQQAGAGDVGQQGPPWVTPSTSTPSSDLQSMTTTLDTAALENDLMTTMNPAHTHRVAGQQHQCEAEECQDDDDDDVYIVRVL
ncbi:uncharacterized protein ACJ7VT_007405 [Polymixia lowei]